MDVALLQLLNGRARSPSATFSFEYSLTQRIVKYSIDIQTINLLPSAVTRLLIFHRTVVRYSFILLVCFIVLCLQRVSNAENCIIESADCDEPTQKKAIVVAIDGIDFLSTIEGLSDHLLNGTFLDFRDNFERTEGYLAGNIQGNGAWAEMALGNKIELVEFLWHGDPGETLQVMDCLLEGDDNFCGLLPLRAKADEIDAKLIIVAHSWGTVLTYLALNAEPELNPDLVILLSSPLGSGFKNLEGCIQDLNCPLVAESLIQTYTAPYLIGGQVYNLLVNNERKPKAKRLYNYWSWGDIISGPVTELFDASEFSLDIRIDNLAENTLNRSAFTFPNWHSYTGLSIEITNTANLETEIDLFHLIEREIQAQVYTLAKAENIYPKNNLVYNINNFESKLQWRDNGAGGIFYIHFGDRPDPPLVKTIRVADREEGHVPDDLGCPKTREFPLGPLQVGKSYYWRIDTNEFQGDFNLDGEVFFTTTGHTNTFSLTESPSLWISSNNLEFVVSHGENPSNQRVSIASIGAEGNFPWTARVTAGSSWITIDDNENTSGLSPANFDVMLNAANREPGIHFGQITVTMDGFQSSPQTISVKLNIAPVPINEPLEIASDTFVNALLPNTSQEALQTLSVGTPPVGNSSHSLQIGLIKFILGNIKGKNIGEAKLKLYVTQKTGFINLRIMSINKAWTESIDYDEWQTNGFAGENPSVEISNFSEGWIEVDVKRHIEAWAEDQDYFGFGIFPNGSIPSRGTVKIASSEYFDTTKHPTLEVRYVVTGPTDLEVTNPIIEDAITDTFVVGDQVTLNWTALNHGPKDIEDFDTGVYLGTNPTDFSNYIDDRDGDVLSPGETEDLNFDYQFQEQDIGIRYFVITANKNGKFSDTNTSNDIKYLGPFQVVPQPDFSLSITEGPLQVVQGNELKIFTFVNSISDFSGSVNLSASNVPENVEVLFELESIVPFGTSGVTISTSLNSGIGNHSFTIHGNGGEKNHTANVNFAIIENLPPAITDFPNNQKILLRELAELSVQVRDEDPDTLTYEWNFGDGTTSKKGNNVTHYYIEPANYTVTVRVTDNLGQEAETSFQIEVEQPLVSGYLKEKASGLSITGITVWLLSETGVWQYTDSDSSGYFYFNNLEDGNYDLHVFSGRDRHGNRFLDIEQEVIIKDQLPVSQDILVNQAGFIAIKVQNEQGTPLPFSNLVALAQTHENNGSWTEHYGEHINNGLFEILLPSTEIDIYKITIHNNEETATDGSAYQSKIIDSFFSASLSGTDAGVATLKSGGGFIKLSVANSEPPMDTTVFESYIESELGIISRPEGYLYNGSSFELQGYPSNRNFWLKLVDWGYYIRPFVTDFASGERYIGPFNLTGSSPGQEVLLPSFKIPPTGSLSGRATDQLGTPVAGIEIAITGFDIFGGWWPFDDDEFATDGDGYYEINRIPAGKYTINIAYPNGFAFEAYRSNQQIEIFENENTIHDITDLKFIAEPVPFFGKIDNFQDIAPKNSTGETLPFNKIDYEAFPIANNLLVVSLPAELVLHDAVILRPETYISGIGEVNDGYNLDYKQVDEGGEFSGIARSGNHRFFAIRESKTTHGTQMLFGNELQFNNTSDTLSGPLELHMPIGTGTITGKISFPGGLESTTSPRSAAVYLRDGNAEEAENNNTLGRIIAYPGPSGMYALENVPQSRYHIRVVAPDLKTTVSDDFIINTGETKVMDFLLEQSDETLFAESFHATRFTSNDPVQFTWATIDDAKFYEVWRSHTNSLSDAVKISSNLQGTSSSDIPPQDGKAYYYWVRVELNDGSEKYSFPVVGSRNLPTQETYENWKLRMFGLHKGSPPTNTSLNEDFNQDGIANLLDYALGLDPTQRNSQHLPSVSIEPEENTAFLCFFYSRSRSSTGFSIVVESAESLSGTWKTFSGIVTIDGGNEVSDFVKVKVPLESATKHSFLRLRVE